MKLYGPNGQPLFQPPAVQGRVEIVRSFTYKLNVGNYEARDFFMSQKAECAVEDQERVSESLYQFCKSQVMKAVNDYLAVQSIRERELPKRAMGGR